MTISTPDVKDHNQKMNINLLYVDEEPAVLEIGRLYLERDPEIIITTDDSADEALQMIRPNTFEIFSHEVQDGG